MNVSPPGSRSLSPPLLAAAFVLMSTVASAATISFTSDAANSNIKIPEVGRASIYPSIITVTEDAAKGFVSGVTITDVKVLLNDITHPYPEDLNFLLVGPDGAQVLLLSDPAGDNALVAKDLVISSTGAEIPHDDPITGTEYQPTNWGAMDEFPSPAPTGSYHGIDLSVFNGVNPFGNWSLFVHDDYNQIGVSTDKGSLVGWSLDFTFSESPSVADASAPEPGTLVLMGTGLAALVRRMRRRPAATA